MAVWGMPALAPEESAALEHDYRYHASRLVRQRSHLVLLCAELETQAEVARGVRCSLDTVQRTLNLYRTGGRFALRERRGRRGTLHFHRRNLVWLKALALAMEAGPEACGIPRPTWTAPLLAQYLCRRGTWTVRHRAEEDEDYLPKRKGSRRS